MRLRQILPAIALTTLVGAAAAQNEEIEAAKKRIQVLTNQAEELMQAGRVNQAERLLNQAKELKARIARAQDRAAKAKHEHGSDDYHGLFHHLEHAVDALRKLGKVEQAEKLSGWARELHQDLRRSHRQQRGEHRERREPRSDREQLQWEIDVFRFAKRMYQELEKEKLVELVERSMHSREMKLAGRRDREAQQIIRAQPTWGNEVELLNHAAQLYKKHEAEERASALAKLAGQIAGRHEDRGPEKTAKRRPTEREVALQQLELMSYAADVLKKAKRADAADSMQRAAQALKLRLAGRRDEEARRVYERAPGRKANAAHLAIAAEILQDQGKREAAQALAKLSRQFAETAKRTAGEHRERDRDVRRDRREGEHREERGDRDVRRDREARRERDARRDRERGERGREEEIEEVHEKREHDSRRAGTEKRIAELRKQIAELEKVLEELRAARKKRDRRDN